jgi:signal peptidase I
MSEGRPQGRAEGEGGAGREPSWLRDELPSLLGAIAVALLVRTFVVQTFYVPSESMVPTLLIGDHVFVNKFVYGPQLPGAGWRLPALREPRRGEVIVFRFARTPYDAIVPPDADPSLPTDNFVKRLVGVPGDRIAFHGDRLILNGEPVPLEHTGRVYVAADGIPRDLLIETLGDCRHFVLDDPLRPSRELNEIQVPEGRYLFMGDNRDNSEDGRWAGTVPLAALAGPAGLNYWSWDWNGSWLSLLNPLTWLENLTTRMRWERMGSFVECFPPGETPELAGAVRRGD